MKKKRYIKASRAAGGQQGRACGGINYTHKLTIFILVLAASPAVGAVPILIVIVAVHPEIDISIPILGVFLADDDIPDRFRSRWGKGRGSGMSCGRRDG